MEYKCTYCKSNKKREFMLSVDTLCYFFNCDICSALTYFKFPEYIPIEQYKKYINQKHNQKYVW